MNKKTLSFITRSKEIHKNRFDYSLCEYVNQKTKVTLLCKHGSFSTRPDGHLKGVVSCRDCYIEDRNDTTKKRRLQIAREQVDSFQKRFPDAKVGEITFRNNRPCVELICDCPEKKIRRIDNLDAPCSRCEKNKNLIKQLEKRFGQKNDYSETVFGEANGHQTLTYRCKEHNQTITVDTWRHLRGVDSCSNCRTKKRQYTKNDFIEKSRDKWGDRYDYTQCSFTELNNPISNIYCREHNSFFGASKASRHYNRNSICKHCQKENSKVSKQAFIDSCSIEHQKKYDYSLLPNVFFVTAYITVICPDHGPFEVAGRYHKMGRDCRKCTSDRNGKKKRMNFEAFRTLANKAHDNKYQYIKNEYKKLSSKTTIVCPTHGPFEQLAQSHIKGIGCPKCGIEKQRITSTKSTKEFVTQANKLHGGIYDYSKTQYVGAHIKVTVTCKLHGDWRVSPTAHLSSKIPRCPKCACTVSKSENKWLDSLGLDLERQKSLRINGYKKPIRVDGFDLKTKTVYLFHGDFWHGNPTKYPKNKVNPVNKKTFGKLYEETKLYETRLRDAGYNVISIWESEFKQSLK